MKNIYILSNCYGCGVCSSVCPRHLISLYLNNDGFYQPIINEVGRCVECGLCLKVCSQYNTPDFVVTERIVGYASWSKEPVVRRISSSGGTGFEIARLLIGDGYNFIGVKYNVDRIRAEHYVTNKINSLPDSMGSKYIQSYSEDAFKQIQKGKRYIITGTPCQIASLRRLIEMKHMEEDVVLVDFFCHGVPSMNVWKKYVGEIERKIGKISFVSWRNKTSGWHDSWAIEMNGKETGETIDWHDSYNLLIKEKKIFVSSKWSDGDLFYKFFLGDMCLNKSCYKHCIFKKYQSAADIRIGDLWGDKYSDNELGVTGVLAFTRKGVDVLERSNVVLIQENIDVVAEGQIANSPRKPYYYTFLMSLIRSSLSLKIIYRITQLLRIGTIVRYKFNMVK